MKVRKFLSMMLMSSSVDSVRFDMKGATLKTLNIDAVKRCDYFGFDDDTVITFGIIGNVLVLNLKPTF